MKQTFLLERELAPDQTAKVIDFLRTEGMVWHDSYALIKVHDSKEAGLVLLKEISDRLGVPIRDLMPEGVHGKILGKFEPLSLSDSLTRDRSYKAWLNFEGLNGDKIVKIGFKSALARMEKLQLGQESLELLAEFATMRSPSFLPEVPTGYFLQVKDVFGCPKLSGLDSACSRDVTQYFTELVQQLRSI